MAGDSIIPPTTPWPAEIPAMPTRAVLFDFDGVLADTENIHIAAWQRTLEALGWTESDGTCARAVEIDDRAFLREVFARHDIADGNVEGWVRRKQDLAVRLLADSPRVFPGVAALVDQLRGRVRLAVVTTTWRANVETVLDACGLRPAFEVIVAKEDVTAPKPDPEGYRLALTQLGVEPSEAVALEDSPTGLAAARAAGIAVVAVGHRHEAGEWSGGSPYLANFVDADAALAAFGLAG